MKFSMWVEFNKLGEDRWNYSFCIHNANINDKKLFIENYPISSYTEDGITSEHQVFTFNKILLKEIQQLLFNGKRHITTTENKAWDFHHFLFHEGFRDYVHPVSRSSDFLRDGFDGTQEEIYEKCLQIHNKWIKE